MCANSSLRKKLVSPGMTYIIIAVVAILGGLSDIHFIHATASVIADIFIKLFKCISLPIITLSIIVTLSQYGTDQTMKGLWKKTLFYTMGTTVLAASVACALYLIIAPANMSTIGAPMVDHESTVGTDSFFFLIVFFPLLCPLFFRSCFRL